MKISGQKELLALIVWKRIIMKQNCSDMHITRIHWATAVKIFASFSFMSIILISPSGHTIQPQMPV